MSDPEREWPAPWVRAVLGTGVLAVLADEDLHGYAITERLAQRGLGRPRGGSLYPLLEALQQDGAVAATWQEGERGPGRRTYRLTEHGRSRLREERVALERLVAVLGADSETDSGEGESR